MRSRALALRKETLTELATGELAGVAGASHHCVTYTAVPTGCMCTGISPSLNVDCPVGALTDAIAGSFELSRCICT